MSKYQIGQRVPRESKTPLVVFECLEGGVYLARTVHKSVRIHELNGVNGEEPKPGQMILLHGSRQFILVGPSPRFSGSWDIAYNDRIELTEKQIEEALADDNARAVYSSVATRRERGGNSLNTRFFPKRCEPSNDDSGF